MPNLQYCAHLSKWDTSNTSLDCSSQYRWIPSEVSSQWSHRYRRPSKGSIWYEVSDACYVDILQFKFQIVAPFYTNSSTSRIYIYMTLSCVSIWEVCLEFIQCRFVSQECVCNYWLYRMARQTSQWHCPWYCPASLRNSKLCQQWMVSSVYTETSFECCDMRLRELEYSV